MSTDSVWNKRLRKSFLKKAGKKSSTLSELAEALSELSNDSFNGDTLHNGYKRNRKRLGLPESVTSYFSKEGKRVDKPKLPKAGDIRFPLTSKRKKELRKAKRFVVTSALNNSDIDSKVWGALKRYAKEVKAEIIVLPVRYKNPTSRVDGKVIGEGAWWPDELLPYMTDELVELHEHFWVMGHVRIQATAQNPLSGLETLSKGASAAFAHPQLAMKMVATPQNKLPKVLYTTGSVSQANYSATKAGVKGDFHHSLGGLIIELDGPRFYPRALVADDTGGFCDVDRYYTAKGSKKSIAEALVTGDEHALFTDPQCKAATYTNKDSIAKVTKAKIIVKHDVFDGYSVNYHSDKNVVSNIAKADAGGAYLLVREELQLTVDYINETTPKGSTSLIVESNHHDHLAMWLMSKTMGEVAKEGNARIFHELWGLTLPTVRMTANGAKCDDPFMLWAKPRFTCKVKFLHKSSPTIKGIDITHHGHRGANGARGSSQAFARIGVRTITGHSHSPCILFGTYCVGTSSMLELEYTGGLSSWAHCHCLVHPNGKRQLIFIIDGHWRL
ncbi:MAG: hypothetical protein L3J47_00005 [Sulfurovum sp.]|nr:hypothetical protein [Sulfurovum sp.]